jgi:hypothetical protein
VSALGRITLLPPPKHLERPAVLACPTLNELVHVQAPLIILAKGDALLHRVE